MSRFLAPSLAGLAPYVPGEQPRGIAGLLKLNTNENPFPPSPRVTAALTQAQTVEDLRLYSDPACADFLAALADTFGVGQGQVFASNGSDEALAFCFAGLCAQGAAFADVTYGFYPVFAALYGVQADIVPLRADWRLAVEDYAGRKGTVFIANPNAPTGLALGLGDMETLLRQDENRLVVVDEAYVDFGAQSARALLDRYDNLLVVGTFSKSRSLAGARLGYAVGSEALIADLNRVKFSFNPYNVNRLTLLAGTAALADRDYFDQCRRAVMDARDETARALRALGFAVTDSRANFLFAAPPAPLTGKTYFERLRQRDILVRWFGAPRTENYVRITVGTDAQMARLLQATKAICKEMGL